MMKSLSTLALSLMIAGSMGAPAAFAKDATTQTQGKPAVQVAHEHHKGHGEHKDHKRCAAMKEMNLTDAQKEQMKAAHKTFKEQNKAAFESMHAKYKQLKELGKDEANAAKRAQLKAELKQEREALHAKKKASMAGILTPEQQAKWDAAKQQCKAEWKNKKQDKPAN